MRFNGFECAPDGAKSHSQMPGCSLVLKMGCSGPANTDRFTMSEFKYACPVCGQHMKCDSSQSGTVMECPTCFQKITAPQAPKTDDPKFILTGTKVGERPIPTVVANVEATPAPMPEKSSPLPAIIFIVLFCVAAAALFAFHGRIFKSTGGQGVPGLSQPQKPVRPPPPPKPVVVAPPANDANWMLDLAAVTIPDSTAAGRVHGRDFICDRAILQGGTLTLRGATDLGATVNFGGVLPEALAGQSINVATNAEKAARVILRWKEGDLSLRENFTNGYALRIEFGQLAGNRMPGKIYLCMPDAGKSYITGNFDAEIRKPKPPKQK
jgi:DNA-directed RNA polymerase subunit RPC12/RpoP